MSGHTCQQCGAYIECDKRQLGGGRKHDVDWKPGQNHDTVKMQLALMGGWQTVKGIQMALNNRVVNGQTIAHHAGKSTYWTQLAVQTPISDLLGIDVLESRPMLKGRERLYRVRSP